MTIPDLAVWAVEVTERREEEMSTETTPRIMGIGLPKMDANLTHEGRSYSWIQTLGYVEAKPVEELQPGEFRVYNFGSTAEVISVEKAGKMWALTVRTEKGESTRKHRAGTLIAFALPR